jgi:hypothetical protein
MIRRAAEGFAWAVTAAAPGVVGRGVGASSDIALQVSRNSAGTLSSRRASWVTDWVTTDAQRLPERAPTARGGPELRGPRTLSSAHNPKVAGSNPAPAIGKAPQIAGFFRGSSRSRIWNSYQSLGARP